METRHVMGISDNNQVDVTEAFNYLHVLLTYLLKMRDKPIKILRHHGTVLLRTFWPAAAFL